MRTCSCVTTLTFLVFLSPAAGQGTARFSQHGVSFDYPKDWKVTTTTRYGVSAVLLKSSNGIEATLHLHPPGTNPIGVRIQLEREIQQANDGKLGEVPDEPPKCKFSVGEQEGVLVVIKGEGDMLVHHELYAFALNNKKKQVCVAHFQYPAADAPAARKAFAVIAESLADEGAKPGVKLAPVIPPVRLASPIPMGWELHRATKGEKIWSDRDYIFTQLPKEIEGGLMVYRTADEGKYWLDGQRVTVLRDCTAYAIVRSRYQGKIMIDRTIFRKLAGDGWKEFQGAAASSFPPGEDWGWRVIKMDLKKGQEIPPLREMTWGQPTVFVFK